MELYTLQFQTEEEFMDTVKKYVTSALCVFALSGLAATAAHAESGWVAGDFHTHTKMSDGSRAVADLFDKAKEFGLDWFGTSDHGGPGTGDPYGDFWVNDPDQYIILGNYWENPLGIQGMWRWQALSEYAFPVIEEYREGNTDKMIWQGFEWMVPQANDATVVILDDSPNYTFINGKGENKNLLPISEFEYMFCHYDQDSYLDLPKNNMLFEHAVTAAAWLQDNYPDSSFISINHPSRSLEWSPGEIRDLHNAAPGVVVGMTAFPGHQLEEHRGGYDKTILIKGGKEDISYKARTYGGADYMTAKVGGLWDSLLGEGRRFYVAGVSDFHHTSGDFWPGEYAKTHVYVENTNDRQALVAGLKSGRSFTALGDLIDRLEFTAEGIDDAAYSGGTVNVAAGENVVLTIRFASPVANNNGDTVAVDHVDLIAGQVAGYKIPGTSDYRKSETNPTTRVEARFSSWEVDSEGYNLITYTVENVSSDMYVRLRGTNLGVDVVNETDAEGNPLMDDLMGENSEELVWADLWFYSNPIFIEVE